MKSEKHLQTIKVKDKEFVLFISEKEILSKTVALGKQLSVDFKDKHPIFIGILNGSFMFASDLMKEITIPTEITFVKLASYIGTQSSGKVLTLLGLDVDVTDRHIIIVEDIVDTGRTLHKFLPVIQANEPASVSVCSLLFKPDALEADVTVHYTGFKIPNHFVVGYGLDYDGDGRNLKNIYKVID